jgi:hypothetical protein
VANFAAYTQDKATQINLIEKWIPLAIAGIGMTAAIIAAVMLIAGPSRTRVAA